MKRSINNQTSRYASTSAIDGSSPAPVNLRYHLNKWMWRTAAGSRRARRWNPLPRQEAIYFILSSFKRGISVRDIDQLRAFNARSAFNSYALRSWSSGAAESCAVQQGGAASGSIDCWGLHAVSPHYNHNTWVVRDLVFEGRAIKCDPFFVFARRSKDDAHFQP